MDQVDLLHQIGGVSYPHIEALALKRGGLVRRISDREHVINTPVLGYQGIEFVYRGPHYLDIIGVQVRPN